MRIPPEVVAHLVKKALSSTENINFRHAATVIVPGSKDKRTYVGINQSYYPENRSTLHAEMAAVVGYFHIPRKQRRRCVVFVLRVTNQKVTRLSKPCKNCRASLFRLGFRIVSYTENDQSIKTLILTGGETYIEL